MKKAFKLLTTVFALISLISCNKPKTYTVIWQNYDNSVLETDEKVKKGETPEYNGQIPTKPSDDAYAYDFDGWEPELAEVSGDVTYVASFKAIRLLNVKFVNYDNASLYETIIREDELPEYKGDIPTKEEDMVNTYSFNGWTPEIGSISEDTTYVALYTAIPIIYYQVKFVNYDDSLLYETTVREGRDATYGGETPTCPEDEEFDYEFDGWDKDLSNVQSDMIIKAKYKAVAKDGWGPIIWF